MLTLVWRTDIHLSDYAPRSRKDDWTSTILSKIKQIGDIAREVQADAVIDGGDFFSIKSPIKNSHSLVRQAIEAHEGYPCPVYATIGNHDCIYGNYNYLDQQPLGVLFASGIFRRLYDQHEGWFLGSPSITVRVVGIPYHGMKYDLSRFDAIQKGGEDYLVVIAHLFASPSGGMVFENEDVVRYSHLDQHPADLFCFGHWHKYQGIYENEKGPRIVNVGAVSRGSISEDDVSRIPEVVILRFSEKGIQVEERPLRVASASEIFDLGGRAYEDLKQNATDEFVAKLGASLARDYRKPIPDVVREMDLPEGVKEKMLVYLEKAVPDRSVKVTP